MMFAKGRDTRLFEPMRRSYSQSIHRGNKYIIHKILKDTKTFWPRAPPFSSRSPPSEHTSCCVVTLGTQKTEIIRTEEIRQCACRTGASPC